MPRRLTLALVAPAVLACLACLAAGPPKPPPSLTDLADAGRKLTDDAAKKIEATVAADPADGDDRARLLGYYLTRSAARRDARVPVVLWMIDHHPADPVTPAYATVSAAADPAGYAKAAAVWDKQTAAHPTDTAVLGNAATFFAAADDAKAEALLQQAAALDAKTAGWQVRLAELYEARAAAHPDQAAALYTTAMTCRQTAYKLAPEGAERFHALIAIPADALGTGDMIAAKRQANELLVVAHDFKSDPSYGYAVHRADVVLGRAALAANQLSKADEYLAAAAAVPTSPPLAAAGPDTNLARDLLAAGERSAVRDYLVACNRLWPGGSARLKAWVDTVDKGDAPDFTK